MQADSISRNFTLGAMKLMEQRMSDPSDMSLACAQLKRALPEGLRSFLTDDKIWIHHFNEVLNVPKGSLYRAQDGEWHEAEDDMMIVIHCGAGGQMMSQK
jgi:hypothetical protein